MAIKQQRIITRLGNPMLRHVSSQLTHAQILSEPIQQLIRDMKAIVDSEKYGVGLAAPQVGESVALSIIAIKPTPNRPDLKPFESVIINPEIVETHGHRQQLWEGCISVGKKKDTLFAKVPRYKSVTLKWLDQDARPHRETLTGFPAHVAQHEVDHLNGALFIDKVKDPTTFMMSDEYMKRVVKERHITPRKKDV